MVPIYSENYSYNLKGWRVVTGNESSFDSINDIKLIKIEFLKIDIQIIKPERIAPLQFPYILDKI